MMTIALAGGVSAATEDEAGRPSVNNAQARHLSEASRAAASLLREDYGLTPGDDAEELGSVKCSNAVECSKLCNAESKYCVEHAAHPYKPNVSPGDLIDCIDTTPSAKLGGSYTCLYKYQNEDVCVYSYAARLGPIHPPAPRPLCVYKGGKSG